MEESADVTITNNQAELLGLGGGIYVNGGADLSRHAVLYNNHAGTAGDDIYVNDGGSIAFGSVGSGWILDDCGEAIDSWYYDGYVQSDQGINTNRWNAHFGTPGLYVKEYDGNATGINQKTGLKAAHKLPDAEAVQLYCPGKGKGFPDAGGSVCPDGEYR